MDLDPGAERNSPRCFKPRCIEEKITEDEFMELKTPQSLKIEHEELHDQLSRATKAGELTSEAASSGQELQPHFLKRKSMLYCNWDYCLF